MRRRGIVPFLFIALFLSSCAGIRQNKQQQPGVCDISPDSVFTLVQTLPSDSLVLLDVRTPEEYSEGHISGAVNIDYYSGDFEDRISRLEKQKFYIVYCRSGRRSKAAVGIMMKLGFSDVCNMEGGFRLWVERGFPYQ